MYHQNIQKNRKNFIIPHRERYSLADFYLMKNQEIIETFMTLPNAENIGKGKEQFVYIPGTREDRVLLVAHSDTSAGDVDVELGFDLDLGEFYSRGMHPIGADDRSGCGMLWNLRETGHSLLIPNCEEQGCLGSKFLMESEEWREEINSHKFAVEFDRMNARNLVFYEVGSDEFTEFCEKEWDGYKKDHGSFTDIAVLASAYRHNKPCLCALNISIGYYGQHGSSETQNLSEWNHTLQKTHEVLSKPNLPRFEHDRPKYTSRDSCNSYFSGSYRTRQSYSDYTTAVLPENDTLTSSSLDGITSSVLVCPFCEGILDELEFKRNKECCIFCGKGF